MKAAAVSGGARRKAPVKAEAEPAVASVGDGIRAPNAQWSFGGGIAKSFSQHVRRSVPFYDAGHELVCLLSDFFVREDSTCYEIGVAAGDLLARLTAHHSHRSARWIGLDTEAEMVERARAQLAGVPRVALERADAATYDFAPADFIVSYYTVQFVPPKFRQQLIDRIYQSLNWGGAFVLFEKVRACDARFQDLATAIYSEFKLKNGFSATEILAKSRSLKGVLEPFSTQGNLDALRRAGFVDVMSVMKYVCFEGFLAVK